MRYLHFIPVLLLVTIILIFTFQNLEMVTVSFLAASLTLPRALLIAVIYLLGMLTGGFMLQLIKSGWREARKSRSQPKSQG